MAIFQEITLSYKGETKTVKPENVLMLIATIEEYITLKDILGDKPKMAQIAIGFSAALTYAGFMNVNRDEVYKSLFDKETGASTQEILQTLLMMMLPPEDLAEKPDENSGKSEADSENQSVSNS